MDLSIIGYTDLKCPKCDNKNFVAVHQLIWKEGSGMSPRPNGYECTHCHAPADGNSMIREIKRQHAIEKIKELENASNL